MMERASDALDIGDVVGDMEASLKCESSCPK